MNSSKEKYNRKHAIGIVFGILVSISILFSQSFYFTYINNVENTSSKEIEKNCGEIPSSALAMYPQAIHYVSHFIVDSLQYYVPLVNYGEVSTDNEMKLESEDWLISYMETLFTMIISPNAP